MASGTTIAPTPTERLLARGYQRAATGSDLASMTQSVRVADDQRAASSVSLIAGMKVGSVGVGPAVLAIEEGATVSVNPGGSISAYSARQLDLNGTLIARGGEVALSGGNYEDKGLSGEEVYDHARSLHVGATALIDVSGVAVYDPNPVAGRLTGKVLDGGSLTLDAALQIAVTANPHLIATRLKRPVDTAGIDVAAERPNPDLSYEFNRDFPRHNFSVAIPLEIGGQRGDGARRGLGQGVLRAAPALDLRRGEDHQLDAEAGIEFAELLLEELHQPGIVAVGPAGADRGPIDRAVDAVKRELELARADARLLELSAQRGNQAAGRGGDVFGSADRLGEGEARAEGG